LRSVSALQPILPAIDTIAVHCESCCPSDARTIATARSTTSGENFGDFLMMAPSSQTKEPPQNPGRFTESAIASSTISQ